jgi:hypothetical protein
MNEETKKSLKNGIAFLQGACDRNVTGIMLADTLASARFWLDRAQRLDAVCNKLRREKGGAQ